MVPRAVSPESGYAPVVAGENTTSVVAFGSGLEGRRSRVVAFEIPNGLVLPDGILQAQKASAMIRKRQEATDASNAARFFLAAFDAGGSAPGPGKPSGLSKLVR